MRVLWPVFIQFFLILSFAHGQSTHGYVADVGAERSEKFYEVFLFVEPSPVQKSLRDLIFNEELSSEFKRRYRDKFGQIDTESINYRQDNIDRIQANKGQVQSVIKESKTRRTFAEYMTKRLAEWHVDNYIKSEPSMRPVYELKEKLKKVEVRVTKQTKLEGRYSFAGNSMDVILENPVADTVWTIEMDPSGFGPTTPQRNRVMVVKPVDQQNRVEATWYDVSNASKLEWIKSHTQNFATSYGVGTFDKKDDVITIENRVSVGMTYSF